MKKIIKYIGYLFAVILILFVLMKIFFPIFRQAPSGAGNEISKEYNNYSDKKFLVVNRFYYAFFPKKSGDMVMFKPVKGALLGGASDDFWVLKVGVVGNRVTIFSKNIESIEKRTSEGYEPVFVDGFDSRTGIISDDRIIGKVIFGF